MKISTITTLTDWTSLAGCWGRPGVYRMLELLHIAGIRDVYWRVFNGGMAMYPSRVAQVQDRHAYDEWQHQRAYPQPTLRVGYLKDCDFNHYDPVPDALEAAAELGINLHLWYTIFEDDHGGPWLSQWAKDHPRYWQMDRDGRTYRGTLDFFFDEVRAYKLAILDELLAYEGTKGLMLDFVRHNACPSADARGIHRFGYNPEIREHYRQSAGTDPVDLPADDAGWLSFKRDYMTTFLNEVRRRLDATGPGRELSMMIWPVDYARWACIDIPRLTRDQTVQMLNAFSLAYTFHPREIVKQHEIMRQQVEADSCQLLPGIMCYNGIYPDDINACAETAEAHGIEQLMLYEADALVQHNLLTTVRAINTGGPTYARPLRATRVAGAAEAIDWSTIAEHSDFLFNSGPTLGPKPSEKTALQIAYGPADIFFRFTCWDGQMDQALAPVPENPHLQYYLDALGPRTHFVYTHGVNLFLDPTQCHQNFHHFYVSPNNDRLQETMADDQWSGEWDSSVQVEDDRWIAQMCIPYRTLGVDRPKPGDRWGINVLRGIRHAEETNGWFSLRWTQPYPDDMGHLRFD